MIKDNNIKHPTQLQPANPGQIRNPVGEVFVPQWMKQPAANEPPPPEVIAEHEKRVRDQERRRVARGGAPVDPHLDPAEQWRANAPAGMPLPQWAKPIAPNTPPPDIEQDIARMREEAEGAQPSPAMIARVIEATQAPELHTPGLDEALRRAVEACSHVEPQQPTISTSEPES
jgi:hypothetical protein